MAREKRRELAARSTADGLQRFSQRFSGKRLKKRSELGDPQGHVPSVYETKCISYTFSTEVVVSVVAGKSFESNSKRDFGSDICSEIWTKNRKFVTIHEN